MAADTRRTYGLGLAFGVAFGFWLSWTRFVEYGTILGGLTFSNLYLWFMFCTAVAVGMIGLQIARRTLGTTLVTGAPLGWQTLKPHRDHVLGSVLFGLGWAVAGACPGPAIAQLGRGQLSGLFTLAGIFAGVATAGWLRERRAAGPEVCAGEVQEGAALDVRA